MLTKFLEENKVRNWNLKSVVVMQGDEIIAEHYNEDKNILHPQYSIAKAFTSTAIGIIQDRKGIDLDGYISDYIGNIEDSRISRIKIKHLLMNAMGCGEGYLFEADRHTHNTNDYLSLILSKSLDYEPGEKYVYSNSNFYLLSRIAENVTGTPLDDFIKSEIFEPLDIIEYRASRCPMNHFLGGSGLYLKTEDMIKLGVLYVNKGIYRNKRIICGQYIEQALSPQIKLNSKEKYGYGFMMKDNRCAYVPGNYNQLLLIDKNNSLSVGINSDVRPSESGTLMKIVRRTIINSD